VYRLYGAQGKVENEHFAAEGHDYGATKRLAMYKFMARHLGLNLKAVVSETGALDESDSILPEESLKVFTPDTPIPAGSLSGTEAVNAVLGRMKAGNP
jgi:hypothetical protein